MVLRGGACDGTDRRGAGRQTEGASHRRDGADPRDRAILSRAASLLDSVGADVRTPAEVVVPCMLAAQLLECAGGRARRVPLIGGEIGPTIRAAMTGHVAARQSNFRDR